MNNISDTIWVIIDFFGSGNFTSAYIRRKLIFLRKIIVLFCQKNVCKIGTNIMCIKSICSNIQTGHFSITMTAITLKLTIIFLFWKHRFKFQINTNISRNFYKKRIYTFQIRNADLDDFGTLLYELSVPRHAKVSFYDRNIWIVEFRS